MLKKLKLGLTIVFFLYAATTLAAGTQSGASYYSSGFSFGLA